MKKMHPSSEMMSGGYDMKHASGSIKTPLYQTSTFGFDSAEQGKAYFEIAYGLRKPFNGESLGYIYSRIDNPNLTLVEKRMCHWDTADDAAVFASGMAAISTVFLTYLRPGDTVFFGTPLYGGTDHFIHHVLPTFGVNVISLPAKKSMSDYRNTIIGNHMQGKRSIVFLETPTNPTLDVYDIAEFADITRGLQDVGEEVFLVVDNTFMGPVWQQPLELGADLVVYSATKYIGGHSDVVAGIVMGRKEHMPQIKAMRSFMGNMADPHTCWLITRSLETLEIRMEKQAKTAMHIADYLRSHPMVEELFFLGDLPENSVAGSIMKKQCTSGGAMVSFNIRGGEAEAFKFLNALRVFKLAVSLGSTESLAQHPYSMTHAGVDHDEKIAMGITNQLVRLSIGLEHTEDLIEDIRRAFDEVIPKKSAMYAPSLEGIYMD